LTPFLGVSSFTYAEAVWTQKLPDQGAAILAAHRAGYFRSRRRGRENPAERWFADSALEEGGFELPVPLTPTPLRAAKITLGL
jgi:hypothetical protein